MEHQQLKPDEEKKGGYAVIVMFTVAAIALAIILKIFFFKE